MPSLYLFILVCIWSHLHHTLQHSKLKIAQRVSILCWHKPNFTPPFSSFPSPYTSYPPKQSSAALKIAWNITKQMKWKLIFFFFFFFWNRIIYPCDYYLSCCSSGAKGGEIILQLMAEDSQPYCNHEMTHLEEIALHIALPWASIILTPGINGWVNGLQKSFNLCQAELRISNGFCFSKCPDKAFPFSLSEKSNYHIISLNGSSEPIFHNIWWKQFWHSLHDSCFIVAC